MTERIKEFLKQLSLDIAKLLNIDSYEQNKLCPIKVENEQPRRTDKRNPYQDSGY